MSDVNRKTTNRAKYDELENRKAERYIELYGPSIPGNFAQYEDGEYTLGPGKPEADIKGSVRDPVKGFWDPSGGLPGSPSDGDRWISTATANGWQNKYIYTWDATNTQWVEDNAPFPGMMAFVISLGEYYYYTAGSWDKMTAGGVTVHADLTGLGADDHTQYHNNTRGDVRYFRQNQFIATSVGVGSAGAPIKLDAQGRLDSTFYRQTDINHQSITGAGTNTHAQIDTHIGNAAIHFTEGNIDHTAIQNIGTNSHAQIDSHIGDATIHFTEASIDHTAIQNVGSNTHAQIDTHIGTGNIHYLQSAIDHTVIQNRGTNTHAQIDTHISNSGIHFTEGSIDHANIQNVGTNTHGQIDTHIADSTIHFTEASISHANIANLGADDHTQYILVDGTRGFSAVVAGIDPTAASHLATKGYVDGAVSGTDPQDAVKSFYDPTGGLPSPAVTGDRYIASATANGWTTNNIYEYNGSTWDETAAATGMTLVVTDEGKGYIFDGANWVNFGTIVSHSALQDLGADDHSQYHNNTRGDARYYQKSEFIASSAGGADAGKPIKLDGVGKLDGSFLVQSDIVHQSITGAGTNTHAQIDTHIGDSTIHFTEASIDHTAIQNVGSNTHAQIDTHIGDSTIHFTEASIDHTAIQNVGTNSHGQIDTHISNSGIHFTEASIDHTAIQNVGTNSHGQIDTHIADSTIHYAEGAIDHANIQNIGTNTHAQIDTHISNSGIHFTEASIVHQNISGAGTNTHAQIDTHISDSTIHFTEGSIVHQNISGAGAYTHAQVDSHINNSSIHFTAGSIDHTAIQNIGTNSHAAIDSHIGTGNIHYLQTAIDHTVILNRGTNSHAAIDSHIASSANPHSVTNTQVGLGNVTNNAQLTRGTNDWNGFGAKTALVGDDRILLEDSAASLAKKYALIKNVRKIGRFEYTAESLDNPVTADWAVNALAPATADSNNSGLTVRLFDDTTAEGVGGTLRIPPEAVNLIVRFASRAETAPGSAQTVRPGLYVREMPDNAAVEAWSSVTLLTALNIPTNENWQYDSQTIALTTLGLVAGRTMQFELTRVPTDASDTLTGDWALLGFTVEFSE